MNPSPSLAPWGDAVLDRANRELPDGPSPWRLLAVRGTLVLHNDTLLAKVARPGQSAGLVRGLNAATALADAGLPVVRPHLPHPLHTSLGVASVWPLLEHRNATAADLTPGEGFAVGRALAQLASLQPAVPLAGWDPFTHVLPWVEQGGWVGGDVQLRLRRLVDQMRRWLQESPPRWQVWAHGDVDVANLLVTDDRVVQLVDLDWCGVQPVGRDLGALQVSLAVEERNEEAWAAALRGWSTVTAPVPTATVDLMSVAKLVSGTAFLLCLPETSSQDMADVVRRRIAVLEDAVTQRRVPDQIPSSRR